jgi:glucosamine--fructose-6-phosphate aminotransferase (isomerizing)
MCGIFGLIATPTGKISECILKKLVSSLYEQSESRGKDASGVMAVTDEKIVIYKEPRRASLMKKSTYYSDVLSIANKSYQEGKSYVICGHTRMATNGTEQDDNNNQPLIKEDLVLLHNGIIVNDLELWKLQPNLKREYKVDTEILSAIINNLMRNGKSFQEAMNIATNLTKGGNTFAAVNANQNSILLTTNNGSLYLYRIPRLGLSIFASEKYILQQAEKIIQTSFKKESNVISKVKPKTIIALSLLDEFNQIKSFKSNLNQHKSESLNRKIQILAKYTAKKNKKIYQVSNTYSEIERHMIFDEYKICNIKRCSKCLLPKTFPFIEFDEKGICQFCRQYHSPSLRGKEELVQLANKIRLTKNKADCLVPISGGRDSCYGLHYIKKELNLNPVAYTYDWGLVTDLARRNISRMCGELGVEHILVAADINKKRENVRKNVTAWLANPDLSMIPLFMAGDKAFFHFASMIKKQMNLGPIIFSMNSLEKTGFKVGFAGINDTYLHEKTYGLTLFNRMKLFKSYTFNFLKNPRYINSSIPDSAFGFFSYYIKNKDYYSIFDFLAWDQKIIESTIINNYDWEMSPDTKSSWRIGDGTAPFYNYIYNTVAGFTEFDTFRSNQIREGMIDRSRAFDLIKEENKPRVESFKWYCDTIGIDAISALKKINAIPKL